jgi:hypothetical protein
MESLSYSVYGSVASVINYEIDGPVWDKTYRHRSIATWRSIDSAVYNPIQDLASRFIDLSICGLMHEKFI